VGGREGGLELCCRNNLLLKRKIIIITTEERERESCVVGALAAAVPGFWRTHDTKDSER
jgi:hypothetical protein